MNEQEIVKVIHQHSALRGEKAHRIARAIVIGREKTYTEQEIIHRLSGGVETYAFLDAFDAAVSVALILGISKEEAMNKVVEHRRKFPPAIPRERHFR